MSDKKYTQEEMDSIVNPQVINEVLDLRGLADEQVAEGRARIERKYGLTPGILGSSKLSAIEDAEKRKIYESHYEATQEEVKAMTIGQYSRWRELGSHIKKAPDIEAEARVQAQAEENAKISKMTIQEYEAYKEEKALKAQQQAEREKQETARLAQEEEQKKVEAIRYKKPEEMTLAEYLTWRKSK